MTTQPTKLDAKYTRKDLQLAACSMAMVYLNMPETSFLWDGLLYDGDSKQELINLLYIEGKLLKAEIDAPKSANHYASTTPIPDWFEAEILRLSKHNPDREILGIGLDHIDAFVISLGEALYWQRWKDGVCNLDSRLPFSDKTFDWLNSQSRDTFKGLLQWVAMELI